MITTDKIEVENWPNTTQLINRRVRIQILIFDIKSSDFELALKASPN